MKDFCDTGVEFQTSNPSPFGYISVVETIMRRKNKTEKSEICRVKGLVDNIQFTMLTSNGHKIPPVCSRPSVVSLGLSELFGPNADQTSSSTTGAPAATHTFVCINMHVFLF